ncbi:hypothetical protein ACHQM5_001341 [Ranunculus cassubicifolius]
MINVWIWFCLQKLLEEFKENPPSKAQRDAEKLKIIRRKNRKFLLEVHQIKIKVNWLQKYQRFCSSSIQRREHWYLSSPNVVDSIPNYIKFCYMVLYGSFLYS